MKIAPIDITHKNFRKKVMGYDPTEVSDFLRDVASGLEDVIKERNQIREALREKELAIVEYKDRDDTLKNTLTTAQKMSERIRGDAEKEAKLILNDAQHQADMIVSDARSSLKKIYEEIAELRRVRLQFESNLKAMAQAHLALLEEGEKFMPTMDAPDQEKSSNLSRSQQISPLSAET